MKILILLALASAASACGWACGRVPPYPFLRNVPFNGIREFREILNDYSLTRADLETKLGEWADRYDVRNSFDNFVKRTDDIKTEVQEDIKKGLEDLTQFFQQLTDIQNDKSLTLAEARKKTRQLYDTLNRKAANAASCLMCTYGPKLDCGNPNYGRPFMPPPLAPPVIAAPAPRVLAMESSGIGYPWYTGSYMVNVGFPGRPWVPPAFLGK